ncbi:MAG: sugar transferase [Candidatus Riflebacteria bacterium]|nr:sugar transferase [Candidatus Riflebacteria bacterium]
MPGDTSARPPRGKRVLDLLVAGTLGVVLLPVAVAVAALVWLEMGSPVLFRQRRPGLGGRPFDIIKFRTMRDGPEPDAERLTALGRWLRRLSLDEIPQLLNILRGEMSLVGPRPLLEEYLPLYTPEQARRHDVLPGATGWAQVNGRNALTWEDTFALDVWYVDHRSLALDLRILLLTAFRVVTGSGVSQPGQATRQKFTGSPPPRP